MDRPIMNPQYLPDVPAKPPRTAPWWWAAFSGALRWAGAQGARAARLVWRALTRGVLPILLLRFAPRRMRLDDGTSPRVRLLRAMMYRAMFLPVLLTLIMMAMVWGATHPRQQPSQLDPACLGIYYDPVDLLTADGVRLEAWLVPVVDARRILTDGERALTQKDPAVVLVHDLGQSRQQMLPLIKPLHDAGFLVLVVGMRRSDSSGTAAATFGLNEAMDVKAAVELLRRRPTVNGARIAVLGVGIGANAARIAAEHDPNISALVLDHPAHSFEEAISDELRLHSACTRWMATPCKWIFELSYGLSADDLRADGAAHSVKDRPILQFDERMPCILQPQHTQAVVDFLTRYLR